MKNRLFFFSPETLTPSALATEVILWLGVSFIAPAEAGPGPGEEGDSSPPLDARGSFAGADTALGGGRGSGWK